MSVLPFPSFLDDVKEKGLKKAVFEVVDESVERLTAGLNIQDLREAIRGEAPSRRPNPRLRPHADGFWLHMRPSYFNSDVTGLYPTFRLGWLSTYFVFFETITGIFLMVWYTPSPQVAYSDMLNILGNVPLGQLIRDLHRLGAEAMVLIVALHMMRTLFTASYKKPRQFTWFTGVILLALTGFLSFTGYLLPWDQLALWAVTIGASMIEATPPEIVGTNLNLLIRGGPEIGANGLLRFYLVHVLALPALLFVFTGVHYYKVILHGHSLPPQKENKGEDTAKRVPLDKRVYFIPDVLTSEIMWIAVTTLILIVLCVWFYDAPLENHADPQITPLGTTAPWYFLWIQGALKLGDKVFWGIIFPGIVVGGLAVLPYLDVSKSRRFADRRVMISVGLALISLSSWFSYMGLSEFAVSTSADSEILHELTFPPAHNHIGKLLPIPFEELKPGYYTTRQFEYGVDSIPQAVEDFNALIEQPFTADANITRNTEEKEIAAELTAAGLQTTSITFRPVPGDAPELYAVMEEFAHLLEINNSELNDAWGAVVITDNQIGLKRLDVIITWNEVQTEGGKPVLGENGEPVLVLNELGEPIRRFNVVHIFIHENSAYFNN
ncbi:MAG: cytochrome bc complex cytochrome b subunit [Anaerolineaceae bacterium]|nr:cytochrome bc complex cytochrome b subunit [Anaerolineaceae bacterium]